MASSDVVGIGVAIVTYHSDDLLRRCLESLQQSAASLVGVILTVVVVDTSAEDSTREIAESYSVAYMGRAGLGYGAALNLANEDLLRSSEYLLNANADVVVSAAAIHEMLYALRSFGASIAGPRTLNADGSFQPTKHGRPTLATTLFSVRKVAQGARGSMPKALSHHYYAQSVDEFAIAPVDWVNGHCLLVDASAYRCLQGWDSRFFLYWEDVDICLRASDLGLSTIYVGTATVTHAQGGSTEAVGFDWWPHYYRSKVIGTRIHVGRLAALYLRIAMPLFRGGA